MSKQSNRQRLVADPFPEAWLPYLDQNVLLARLLPEPHQARLRDAVRIFIAEKYWEGCAGLTITDEMRVTIAGNACLLLLGLEDYYFDELKTVLVYPGGFLSVHEDSGEEERVAHLLGLAAYKGPVLLSWWETSWDGRRLGRNNVVLHEFAHKLAELGDPITGLPPMMDSALEDRWEEVVGREYRRLVEDAEYDRPTLLRPYGATNRNEFFAVATEVFFLEPVALRQRHPELYQLLAAWYRQDPATWKMDEAVVSQAHEAEEQYIRHAIDECSAAIRLRPDYLDAYRDRAGCYRDLGDFDPALADWSEVIRLTDGEERGEACYERGAVHLAAGAHAAALADFDEAVRRCPDLARAWCDRGVALAATGDIEEGLIDLGRALRLDPKDDAAYVERALIYRDQGKHARALRDLSKALRLSPYDASIYCHRAEVRLDLGEPDQAIADCEEALSLDPKLPEPYKHRGVARLRKREHAAALADLDEAIRFDPEYAEAYLARAEVHEARGDEVKARQDRAKAKRLQGEETGPAAG
ncbi:MAG TPA: zinc-dependent peptidase [Gemmataceae bacterium]|nr:zinc-dependent peptidase [Gemmataceae bacterium]